MKDECYLEPSPFSVDKGNLIGKDPREISKSDLEALGHPKSYPKIIRAYCLECCSGQEAEVRKCVSFDCPMWPVRMGRNPFHARAK
jgi:hypothetical protein